MIEINLLPGAGKKKSRGGGGGGPKMDIGAMVANLRERIRQPWLIAAIATTAVALVVVGGLFVTQNARETRVTKAVQEAEHDSTKYASVLKEREMAESKRDTVLRSLNLIRAIDDDRFIWPHVMQEVSKHLPPYTWIVSMGITGVPQGSQAVTTVSAPAADGGKRKRALPTVIARDSIRIRLIGNTVDIQALTRFMKELESSPFLEQVQLAKSERANDNGKEVTQFQLDMMYTRPDPSQVSRVPLAVSVR